VRRALLWFLLLALVVAPALGQLHRITHAPLVAGGPAAHDRAHGDGWVSHLFDGHGDKDCRLFDQLTHSDSLPSLPLLLLPLVLTPFLFRRLERAAVARQAQLFDARGPPALR
jgi:hypothetical protein